MTDGQTDRTLNAEPTEGRVLMLRFLAGRTNGRAYATVLRPSVCRLLRYIL